MNPLRPIMKCFSLTALLLCVLSAPALASDLNVRRTVLKSGLTVLHVQRDNLPVVRLNLLIKSGSVQEDPAKAGLATLTAGLLTEGTALRNSVELNREIEFIGASLGASSSYDYSTVSAAFLSKDTQKGFELFADVLLHPAFAAEELSRKVALTTASLQSSEDDPDFLGNQAFRPLVFGAHPYSRIVRGSKETLAAITRADVENFYRTHYVAGNAILAVVGDISEKDLSALLQQHLSDWKGSAPKPPKLPKIPPAASRIETINRDLTQASILFGHVGIARENPDYYAVQVMDYILGGGGFSSRLMDSVREEKGLAYSIYSSFDSQLHAGHFFISVQTKNGSAREVIREIDRQVRLIQDEPVSIDELADAKSYLTGSFPRRLETMSRIAMFLTLVEFYELGLDYPDHYVSYIEKVTARDVQRVAKKYLDPARATLVIVGNIKETGYADSESPADHK